MPEHPSAIVILAEDQEHQNLVWHYLKNCPQYRRKMRDVRKVALPGSQGCGSQYVREQFPKEVAECRKRHLKPLLIVITDADNLSAVEREQTLHKELAENNHNAVNAAEPIVILVPKWQVETWIKCLVGQTVLESDKNSDRPAVTTQDIVNASRTLHEWARPNAQVGHSCVNSLNAALPRWLRIG